MKKIILDTDIGPDCDDAGALAVLHALADRGWAEILAVLCNTSSAYGAPAITAINRSYGRPHIAVGATSRRGFLEGDQYEKYNRALTNRFCPELKGSSFPDAVILMRQILHESADAAVTLVGIGPLNNIAALIGSPADDISPLTGAQLMERKLAELVLMAGWFAPIDGKRKAEWNVSQDINAARAVASGWKRNLVFSGFEVGLDMITGGDFPQSSSESPTAMAYDLYSPQGRDSWDLTAVHYAVLGLSDLYGLSEEGEVTIDEEGYSHFKDGKGGHHRFLKLCKSKEAVAAELNELLYAPAKSMD